MAAVVVALASLLAVAPFAYAAEEDFDPDFYTTAFAEGICASGKRQTPININSENAKANPIPDERLSTFVFPVVTTPKIINTGHSLKVEWESLDETSLPTVMTGGDKIADVLLDETMAAENPMKMQPIQFHFHTHSEHAVDGLYWVAEMHIVTLIAKGEAPASWGCDDVWDGGDPVLGNCTAVFGVPFILGEEDSDPLIAKLYDEAPTVAGEAGAFSEATYDLNSLLPASFSYFNYYGSLTTPTCDEGLFWHVFDTPLTLTSATIEKMHIFSANTTNIDKSQYNVYRDNYREIYPLGDRTVWYHSDGDATESAESPEEGVAERVAGAVETATESFATAAVMPSMALLAALVLAALAM